MELRIYMADTACLEDETLFYNYFERMPLYRREKVERCRCHLSKIESLGAGAILDAALTEAGIPFSEREILYKGMGKPYLKEHPDVFYNLSHSGSRVMCVLADVPVGCDVEKIRKGNTERIARRFFSEREYQMCKDNPETFTRLWTLKESFIKATGKGLSTPLNSFELMLNDNNACVGVIVDGMPSSQYRLFELDFSDGYKYAVCTDGECKEPSIEWVDLRR